MRKALIVPLVAGLAAPVALAAPAHADTFPRKAVERAIVNQAKDVLKANVKVNCPARSTWKRGAVFYCTAKSPSKQWRLKVTLGAEKKHKFRWVTV